MSFLVSTKEMDRLADEFSYALVDLNPVRIVAAIQAMDKSTDKMNSEEFSEFAQMVVAAILNSLTSLEVQI